MPKIALIQINKDPTNQELKELHRCMDAGTATVKEIPVVGREFATNECPTILLTCLRIDVSEAMKLPPHPFDGHDATIYAVFHSHKMRT